MSTFMDLLRGVYALINGSPAAGRRVNTVDFRAGTGVELQSEFNENSGLLSLTIATGGSSLDEQVSATNRVLGRISPGPGNVEELTGPQVTTLLDVVTSGAKGVAPASGGGTANFLRADGTWAAPSGSLAALSRVLFVDSNSAVTPADGSIRAPFTTLQAAHDAAAANSTIVVIACSTGATLNVTKSISILPWRALIERAFAGYARAGENVSVGAVTVAAGVVLTVTGMNTSSFALPSGGTLNLGQGCDVNGAITGTGDIRISRADLHADVAGASVTIVNSLINSGVDITVSGTSVSLESVWFSGTVSIVFTGSAGTVQMDPLTYEKWVAAAETLTNGTVAVVGLPPEIPVTATLASSENNWLPTGFAYGRYLRVNASSAALSITGFSTTGLAQSRKTIVNSGGNAFTFAHESASSTIANRILSPTGANYVLAVGASIEIFYDITSSRWRLIEPAASASPSGAAGGDLTGTYPNPTIGNAVVDLANLGPDVTALFTALAAPQYLVAALSGDLSNERQAMNTPTVTWDFATTGQAKANVPDDSITNAVLANMAEARVKGRAAGAGAGDPTDLTGTQVTAILDLFTTSVKGLAPSSPGGTASFLRADGSWAVPPTTPSGAAGGSLSGSYPNPTIAANAVSNTEAADMVEARIKGRADGAGTGDPTDLTAAQVRTIINMVLSQVLAGGNTTGANNLAISAAQVLELIAGTPSTAGPANALIEFKREGGGTSSFIGIRTSGGLRYEGQDGVTIAAIGATSHAEMSSGSSGRLALAGGSAGVIVTAQSGQVTIQDLRCLQYDTLSDQGNSDTAKTITWSYSGNTPSALQKLTLTDPCVLTFVNPEMPAYPLMLQIHQDASGGRTITWPATVKNAAALNAALSTTPSTFSQVVFLWNGTFYTWQLVATGLTP